MRTASKFILLVTCITLFMRDARAQITTRLEAGCFLHRASTIDPTLSDTYTDRVDPFMNFCVERRRLHASVGVAHWTDVWLRSRTVPFIPPNIQTHSLFKIRYIAVPLSFGFDAVSTPAWRLGAEGSIAMKYIYSVKGRIGNGVLSPYAWRSNTNPLIHVTPGAGIYLCGRSGPWEGKILAGLTRDVLPSEGSDMTFINKVVALSISYRLSKAPAEEEKKSDAESDEYINR